MTQRRKGNLQLVYTIIRTKEDIKILENLRLYLQHRSCFTGKSWKTDSEIYRELPNLFLDSILKIEDLELKIVGLENEINSLSKLKYHVKDILEIVNEE